MNFEDCVNTIICGDCLEVMKDWPDNCVDLVLTDPPYGKKFARGEHTIGQKGTASFDLRDVAWDNRPSRETFGRLFTISNAQIIWGFQYFVDYLVPTNCVLIWDKVTGNNVFSDFEIAWTSFNSVPKKFTLQWLGSHARRIEPAYHPTQKPVALGKWCLSLTNAEVILDPFCGAGGFCVAAKMLGRRYIGIDVSEKYCEIARQRLEAVDTGVPVKEQRQGQGALFENVNGAKQ